PLADTPRLPDLPRLIRAKYLTPVNRWTAVPTPAVSLLGATAGRPEQSLVWREVLSSYGVVDVASLVFRDKFGCWGWLDLWRTDALGPFTPSELSYLSRICGPITTALRTA